MALSYVSINLGANLNAAKIAITQDVAASGSYSPKVVFRMSSGAYITEGTNGGYLSVILVTADNTQIPLFRYSEDGTPPVYVTLPYGLGTVVEVNNEAAMRIFIKRAANENVYGFNEDLAKVDLSPVLAMLENTESGSYVTGISTRIPLSFEGGVEMGSWDIDTYGLIIPEDGVYRVSGSVCLIFTANSQSTEFGGLIRMRRGSTNSWIAQEYKYRQAGDAGGQTVGLATMVKRFNAGDKIWLFADYNETETLELATHDCFLLVEKVC